jgi:tRNA1(Val) A37 N6-methylase TrmN6
MLWQIELDKENFEILVKKAVDLSGLPKEKLNIFCGNSLEFENISGFLNKIYTNFDIVITNPPFNEDHNKSTIIQPLYDKFFFKFQTISLLIVLITPSRWFCGGRA